MIVIPLAAMGVLLIIVIYSLIVSEIQRYEYYKGVEKCKRLKQ